MNKFRIKQNVLRLVIPLLVVLLTLPAEVMAKWGAQLSVEKTDWEVVKGVLLNVDVEEESLVLNSDNAGIKIYMDEIDTIKIKRKSSIGRDFLGGAVLGAGLGFIFNIGSDGEGIFPKGAVVGVSTVFFGLIGLVGGAVKDISQKKYQKIKIKGKSPYEIKKILEKLKKRVPRYGPPSIHGKTIDTGTLNHGLWFNFGVGGGNIHGFKRVGASSTVTYKLNRNLFTLRYVGLIRPFSEAMYDSASDVGLLIGRVLTDPRQKYLVSAGIGLSMTRVKVGCDNVSTIGIPIEVQFFPVPFLGIYGFANINSKQSFYGLTLCLRLGKK